MLARQLFTILLLAFLVSPCQAQVSERTRIAFDRIDQLRSEEDWCCPFVQVDRYWSWSIDELDGDATVQQCDPFFGFLLHDDESEFVVLGPDLQDHRFEHHSKIGRTEFHTTDFTKFAERLLKNNDQDKPSFREMKVDRTTQLISYARAADKRQDSVACSDLLTLALRNERHATDPNRLNEDLANAEYWRIFLLFDEMDVGRVVILERLKTFLATYPATKHCEAAESLIVKLTAMVEEDAKHVTPTNIASLTVDQQVDEWIFQLRNQNGKQWGQPGYCDVFAHDAFADAIAVIEKDNTHNPIHASPAMQLVKIGLAAVPKLIEALDDTTPTRSLGYHRDFYFSHHVLSVRRCALAALERIAGQSFYSNDPHQSSRELAQKWWDDVQRKGIDQYLLDKKQTMLEAVRRGGHDATDNARELIRKHPELAFSAFKQGIDAAEKEGHRQSLLGCIDWLPQTPETTEYLKSLSNPKWSIETRVQIARMLLDRDREFALEWMNREYKTWRENGSDPIADVEPLVQFMASVRTVKTIRLLLESFHQLRPSCRLNVVTQFRSNLVHDTDERDLELESCIEELLITALSSDQQRVDLSHSFTDDDFQKTRVGHVAAYCLGKHFPHEYQFDRFATTNVREKQRVDAINHWRKKQGIELLPVVELRSVPRADSGLTEPLLQKMTSSDSAEERHLARLDYAKIGPGAIEALQAAIEQLDADHPRKESLTELVTSIANQVTEITVTGRELTSGGSIAVVLDDLKFETFDESTFVYLNKCIAENLPSESRGFRIAIERSSQSSGITIQLHFIDVERGFRSGWKYRYHFNATKSEPGKPSLSGSSSEFPDLKDLNHQFDTRLHRNITEPLEFWFEIECPSER